MPAPVTSGGSSRSRLSLPPVREDTKPIKYKVKLQPSPKVDKLLKAVMNKDLELVSHPGVTGQGTHACGNIPGYILCTEYSSGMVFS